MATDPNAPIGVGGDINIALSFEYGALADRVGRWGESSMRKPLCKAGIQTSGRSIFPIRDRGNNSTHFIICRPTFTVGTNKTNIGILESR